MHKSTCLALLPFAVLLLQGCAWVHQTVNLNPEPRIEPSNIGRGAPVAVRALDKRASKTIGYRGLDSKNAGITTDQDVARLFQQKVVEGLQRRGFAAVPFTDQPSRILTVEIRQIEYTTDMEFWKGIVQVKAALRAHASWNGLLFDQTYVAERKENVVEAPGAKTNERLINETVSEAVQKLLLDDRLTFFLAN